MLCTHCEQKKTKYCTFCITYIISLYMYVYISQIFNPEEEPEFTFFLVELKVG